LVKVGVLGADKCPYGYFDGFIRETAPFECPVESRKKWKSLGARSGL
jgi:hypothetical protein